MNKTKVKTRCLFGAFLLLISVFAYSLASTPTLITHCDTPLNLTERHYQLANDLVCSFEQFGQEQPIMTLHSGVTLDLNGKSIKFNGPLQQGICIAMHDGAKLSSKNNKAILSGFSTAIMVYGNGNTVENLKITESTKGLVVQGDNNSFSKIMLTQNGGIVEQSSDMLHAEFIGFFIFGNNNSIASNEIKDNGFDLTSYPRVLSSAFIQSRGIIVNGKNNKINDNNISDLFANSYAYYNAKSYIEGIMIQGQNNQVSDNTVKNLYGEGERKEAEGLQTGSMVYGILLSNDPGMQGENIAINNKINNISALGSCNLCSQDVGDMTAEAYGIAAYYNNQTVEHNKISNITAYAQSLTRVAGIQLTDVGHKVLNNSVEFVGFAKKNANEPIILKLSGINIDADDVLVSENNVSKSEGDGIVTSRIAKNNRIVDNVSQSNALFDYYELHIKSNINTQQCRNEWVGNKLTHTSYAPQSCFE